MHFLKSMLLTGNVHFTKVLGDSFAGPESQPIPNLVLETLKKYG